VTNRQYKEQILVKFAHRCKTVVSTVYGNSKGFEVKVGMHQATASTVIRDCHGGHI